MHVWFWILIAVFTAYMYHWTLRGSHWIVYVPILATDIVLLTSSYYFLAKIGLPQLYRSHWVLFVASLVAIYVYHTVVNYTLFHLLASRYHVLQRIADGFGTGGIWEALFRNDTFLLNWSFTLSTLTVPVVAKLMKDMLNQQQQTLQLERDNLKLELKFLQSQIQPHFVLNSLNSVYAMVASIDDEASTMLVQLSGLLRYALHETANPTVSLTREVDFLREYMLLEAARQHERASLTFQHEGDLEGYHIPPLLLVTFVENAFKHGINATYRQAWVVFQLKISDEGLLHFHAENSMPPPDTRRGAKPASTGLGIENTRRRLGILFPDRHTLHIQQNTETFTVDLTIQLVRQPDKPDSWVPSTQSTWIRASTPA
jgi:two-component system, LytTR family, sensor kinase